MSTEMPHADQAPAASPAAADSRLKEALCRALLRTLCHKMQSSMEEQVPPRSLGLRSWNRAELIAEMIGDLVGLDVDRVYEAYEDGDYTGSGLIEQLEPLLARGRGCWMTPIDVAATPGVASLPVPGLPRLPCRGCCRLPGGQHALREDAKTERPGPRPDEGTLTGDIQRNPLLPEDGQTARRGGSQRWIVPVRPPASPLAHPATAFTDATLDGRREVHLLKDGQTSRRGRSSDGKS
jgi:hypothetical protein